MSEKPKLSPPIMRQTPTVLEVKAALPAGSKMPDVFLEYQKELLKTTALNKVTICEKSRRIGVTWGIAADAVLTAATNKVDGGMDVFYIGFNLDMTKEFIDTAADWAKAFVPAASSVEEFMFKDIDKNGDTKEIQAFKIKFDSGFSITALTSKPRSLRGRQGYVIIDEAAFHDDLKELIKAAMALLIWGGKVLIISTHDGKDNPFNEYVQDALAGRNKFALLTITFDQALADGLYKRICFSAGKEWTKDGQAAFRQEILDFYGEGGDEELNCIPRNSTGSYLSSVLVESRMDKAVPVVRYEQSNEFVFLPEFEREKIVNDWCSEFLKPLLETLDKTCRHHIGGDFARNGDLSVFHPLAVLKTLDRKTPFTLELRNIPFAQQRQILWYIIDRLPNFASAALDSRGNGQQIAEETMQRYGPEYIHMVMTSIKWYLDAFPKYKAALEDDTMSLPSDDDVLADHRLATIANGIPQIPDKRTKSKDGGKRHGDSLIAAAMAYWATLQDVVEYGYDTPDSSQPHSSFHRPGSSDDSDLSGGRFNSRKGAF